MGIQEGSGYSVERWPEAGFWTWGMRGASWLSRVCSAISQAPRHSESRTRTSCPYNNNAGKTVLGTWHVSFCIVQLLCQSGIWISRGLQTLASCCRWVPGDWNHIYIRWLGRTSNPDQFDSKVCALSMTPYQLPGAGSGKLISQKLEIRSKKWTGMKPFSGQSTLFPTQLLGSSGGREAVPPPRNIGANRTNSRNGMSSILILYVLKIFLYQYCSQFNYNN